MVKYLLDEKIFSTLLQDQEILNRLQDNGVDTWCNYNEAIFGDALEDWNNDNVGIYNMSAKEIIQIYGRNNYKKVEE